MILYSIRKVFKLYEAPWREIVRCFFSTIAIYSNLTAIAIKHNFQNNSNLYVCTGLDVTYDRQTPSFCDPSHEREEKGERKKIMYNLRGGAEVLSQFLLCCPSSFSFPLFFLSFLSLPISCSKFCLYRRAHIFCICG